MQPMLATPGPLPEGPEWTFEVRWDGLRLLVDVADGRLRLTDGARQDLTDAFPELFDVTRLAPDVLLDGVVVLLADGVPSAAALGERLRGPLDLAANRANPVTLMAFDVLRLYGVPLLERPLEQRRATLERLDISDLPAIALSPIYTDGPALLAATAQRGMPGVVAKARDSLYVPGGTSPGWVAVAPPRRLRSAGGP